MTDLERIEKAQKILYSRDANKPLTTEEAVAIGEALAVGKVAVIVNKDNSDDPSIVGFRW